MIAAKEVTYKGEKVQLVNLRNPWGKTEWQGAWNDNDSRWTPALKKECNWVGADDGAFWMPIEDFTKHFSEVSICRVEDTYKTSA